MKCTPKFLMAAAVLLFLATPPSPATAAERLVAAIMPGALPRHQAAHEALTGILAAGGFGEGKLKVFVQKPNPDRMSITNSVRRAVQVGAELLVTYGAPAAEVARKEAKGAPVLFADVYDPVALGLVKSLPVPGTDMTGSCSTVPLKRLVELYQRIRPIDRMGVLFTAAEEGSALQAQELSGLGASGKFTVLTQDVPAADRLPAALTAILDHADVLFLTEGIQMTLHAEEIVQKAAQRGIPVISPIPGLGDKGAVLNLEADPAEQGKLVAVHLLQVLAGQKAHMLPVRSPKKTVLVVNKAAAGDLSLALPEKVVSEGDRLIE